MKTQNRMTNSVDPDEMAHCELSHQDLQFAEKLFWSSRLKGLYMIVFIFIDTENPKIRFQVKLFACVYSFDIFHSAAGIH